MKEQSPTRQGSVLIVVVVIIGILIMLSTVMVQRLANDRLRQDARMNQSQLKLLTADTQRPEFQKKFEGQKEPVSAAFFDFRTNPRQKYEIVVDPTAKRASVTAKANQTGRKQK